MTTVLITAFNNWSRHRSTRLGAALAYYLKTIDRSAASAIGSGLGLARVFAESGMHMSYTRPSDEEIAVTAEFRVPATKPPLPPAS